MTFLQQCEEALRHEGYRPEVLGGRLVRFKVAGLNFAIRNNGRDSDFFKMDVGFSDLGIPRSKYLEIANTINEERKVVKMYVDDDNDVVLSTEILLDKSPGLGDVLPRLIDMLSGAAHIVIQKVKECL